MNVRSLKSRALVYLLTVVVSVGIAATAVSCGSSAVDDSASWTLVHSKLPGALMAVWGSSADDVWAVGADRGDGTGATAMHFDGADWEQLETGVSGDLWWVFGFEDGPIFLGGKDGVILRYRQGEFERMETPGAGTVYGIWGTAPDDLWAVGGQLPAGAFAWRYDGQSWTKAPGFPADLTESQAMFKVWGRSADDVWMVGTGGVAVHFDGSRFSQEDSGTSHILFTVHADDEKLAAVGGLGTGVVLENDGSGWRDVTPDGTPHVMGVWTVSKTAYAVGVEGAVLRRENDTWEAIDTGIDLAEALHAVWQDPEGGVWAVGGQVLAPPLVDGVVVYRDPKAVPES